MNSAIQALFACSVSIGIHMRGAAPETEVIRSIYTEALGRSPTFEQLQELTPRFPGRFAGSEKLNGALTWRKEI